NWNSKRQGIEINVRVWRQEMQRRRDRPVMKRERGFDHTCDSSRSLEVPDVRFDRAQKTFASVVATIGKNGAESAQLHGIATRRAGSVTFNEGYLAGRDAGSCVCGAEDSFLGRPARRCQAVAPPILVRRSAPDQRIDSIAIGQGTRKWFQHQEPCSLAA